MSIQAIAWVLDNSRAEGIARLVLLSLANHANTETGECHPGYRRIAREANCSVGTIHDAVRRLAELGEVEVTARGTGRATTKYHLPWLSTGGRSARSGLNATDAVARDSTSVARDLDPVARDLERAKPEPVNRTAHDTAEPADAGGVVAPKTVTLSDGSRWCPDTGELELVDPGAETPAADTIAETRRRLRDGPEGSKSRHPSTRGAAS